MSEEKPVTEQAEEVKDDQEVVDTSEGTEEAATETEEKDQKKEQQTEEPKKNHDQRRWERLLKERAEFKAKAELYEQQMQQKPQSKNEGRPSRADFEDDESYVDALTDWKLDQKLGTVKQELAQHTQRSQQQTEWISKIQQARNDYPDYDTAMEDAQDIPIQPYVADALQSSELGADIAYYLAKNPEEASRINSLPAMAAVREIGRIESYVEYEKSQKVKAKPVSKAPAPIKPPAKSSSGAAGKSLEDMTPAEYIAYRNKQSSKRR